MRDWPNGLPSSTLGTKAGSVPQDALQRDLGSIFSRWRRDGTEIFYLAPDNKLMVAAGNGTGVSFEVGAVKPLFDTRAIRAFRYAYDVSADGQNFLINTAQEQATSAPITVVLNWTAGLKNSR